MRPARGVEKVNVARSGARKPTVESYGRLALASRVRRGEKSEDTEDLKKSLSQRHGGTEEEERRRIYHGVHGGKSEGTEEEGRRRVSHRGTEARRRRVTCKLRVTARAYR